MKKAAVPSILIAVFRRERGAIRTRPRQRTKHIDLEASSVASQRQLLRLALSRSLLRFRRYDLRADARETLKANGIGQGRILPR